jgi:hypothetical protein
MGGGLMQLVAYGAQDIYLTGNPQITFFKVVYRRHTNFSMESIQQTINGTPSNSGSSTVTISRNGDLVTKIYVTESSSSDLANGSGIIDEVELEIGGQRIDRQTKEWMNIWTELTTPASKAQAFKIMQLDLGHKLTATTSGGVIMAQIPLQFWFCRNPGLALPLIALQYHEVKLKFTWGTLGTSGSPKVWCDYIYLDTDERRRFAQVSHEYLIEQVQTQSFGNTLSEKLNFNHPVKELIWTTPQCTSDAGDATTSAKLVLNGHDRFSEQEDEYFLLRQPYEYHTSVPHQNLPPHLQGQSTQGFGTELISANITAASGTLNGAVVSANTVHVGTVDTLDTGNNTVFTSGQYRIGATVAGQEGYVAGSAGGAFIFPKVLGDLFIAGSSYRLGILGEQVAATFSHVTDLSRSSFVDVYVNASFEVAAGGTPSGTVPAETDVIVNFNTVFVTGTPVNGTHLTITSIREIQPLHGLHEANTSKMKERINVYSFALKPEEHQPSGTCNFSRIDNAKLVFTGTAPTANNNVYAVNYNVLRIMSGMGGLAYSN